MGAMAACCRLQERGASHRVQSEASWCACVRRLLCVPRENTPRQCGCWQMLGRWQAPPAPRLRPPLPAGRMDAKKRLGDSVQDLMSSNIVQCMGSMLDTVAF